MEKTQAKEIAQQVFDRLFPRAAGIVAMGQEHAPILVVDSPEGETAVLPIGLLARNKDEIAHAHWAMAQKKDRVRVAALIMEGWVHKAPAKQDGGPDAVTQAIIEGRLRVSELPDKGEAIIFSIRVGDEHFMCMCPITRPDNTLTKADLFDVNGKGEHAEGRFCDTPARMAN